MSRWWCLQTECCGRQLRQTRATRLPRKAKQPTRRTSRDPEGGPSALIAESPHFRRRCAHWYFHNLFFASLIDLLCISVFRPFSILSLTIMLPR